jgi:hypothetical protein
MDIRMRRLSAIPVDMHIDGVTNLNLVGAGKLMLQQ